MPRFDLDAQRGLVCLFGLTALTCEAVAYYVLGKTLPDLFTGAFITMAIGPVLTTTAEKYREGKRRLEAPPPSPPEPPSETKTDSPLGVQPNGERGD